MHVRLLAGYLNRDSGSAVYNMKLANSLHDRGHLVTVVAFAHSDFLDPAISVAAIRPPDLSRTVLWRLKYPIAAAGANYKVWRARLDKPDLCIAAEHYFVWGHALKFRDVPWIYLPHSRILEEDLSYRSMGLERRIATAFGRRLQAWALGHATTTLRFHQASRDALARSFGLGKEHSFFINPPGIDLPPEDLAGRLRGIEGPIRFLTVGALTKRKNLSLALRCLARHAVDDSWRYDIVGEGDEMSSLTSLVREFGLTRHVTFYGQRNDVADFYRSADVFLFPSLADNAPLVVMEAMSWGLPVVGLDDAVPGVNLCNRDIIRDGENGFLAGSFDEYDRLLEAVLDGRLDVASTGRRARADVLQGFTWDRHVDRMEDMMRGLLDTTGPRGPM